MATSFIIQASCPRASRVHDPGDETLSDALQTVFASDTESALIGWNWVYVPLGYKYDFSIIINDVLDMIEKLDNSPNGQHRVHWPSSTFSAIWHMQWRSGKLNVHAEWHCVLGGTESMLASKPDIDIASEDFIAEWRRPLQLAERALTDAGYSVAQIAGLARLRAVLAKIARDGVLYDA
jgi:hypothetical protein